MKDRMVPDPGLVPAQNIKEGKRVDSNRTIPDFGSFYEHLNPARLEAIYRDITHPALSELLAHGEGEDPDLSRMVSDLIQKLPRISFDIASAATIHLLHEYHQWLVEHVWGGGGEP